MQFDRLARRTRLKLLGRVNVHDIGHDDAFAALLNAPGYRARQRAVTIHVEAFDWNCPQHIPIPTGWLHSAIPKR